MASDSRYQPRRRDKVLPPAEQLALLRRQQVLTIAMAQGDEPYLLTMDYVFVEAENCFYVHCAREGRKLEFLQANPRVWGQVVEDRGYLAGVCSHSYRSVMFQGRVEWVQDLEQKRRALAWLIEKFEPDPAPIKEKFLTPNAVAGVVVLRIRIEALSGKQNPPAKT